MSSTRLEIDRLLAKVEQAFSGVSKGALTMHEAVLSDSYSTTDAERQQARLKDAESRWQDIPYSTIKDCGSGFPFLDPESWRYHIPAFMRWSLVNMSGPIDSAIYALDLRDDPFGRARLDILSPAQFLVVCDFLRFMAARPEEVDAEVAQEALERIQLVRSV
jgi:Family of unknown function (DUF6714)